MNIAGSLKKYQLSLTGGIVTAVIITFVHLKVDPPMLLLERFFPGTGWIEIIAASFYAAVIIYKMSDPAKTEKWRNITWTAFSIVFFAQLALGLTVDALFLMTGKLHLPVPALIIGGPLYRMQLSFMPILFLSTIVLSGPAWCSHLCYFGAFDNMAASGKNKRNQVLKNRNILKYSFLSILIIASVLFHFAGVNNVVSTTAGIIAGIGGILIIPGFSGRKKKMVHCTVYCPVGTLVSHIKYISPFRIVIAGSCTSCMACTAKCKYDALNSEDITSRRPGIACTYCGDCIPSCRYGSIQYKFLNLSASGSRNLYLLITIILHSCFMVLARI